MFSISNFTERIRGIDVRNTLAEGTISQKYYDLREIGDIVRSFAPHNYLNLTREDIFNEQDIKTKFVKILVWGYPGDVRNTPSILNQIDTLIDIHNKYVNKEIEGEQYLNDLLAVNRMGLSTASKILYFMNVRINNSSCVIIDARVISAFQIVHELATIHGTDRNMYKTAVSRIGQIAQENDIDPDQIEYFLFDLGKVWNRHLQTIINNEVQNCNYASIEALLSITSDTRNQDEEKNCESPFSLAGNDINHNETQGVIDNDDNCRLSLQLTYRHIGNTRQLIYPREYFKQIHDCWREGRKVIIIIDEQEFEIKRREKDYQCFRQKEINTWAKLKEEQNSLHDNDIICAELLFKESTH